MAAEQCLPRPGTVLRTTIRKKATTVSFACTSQTNYYFLPKELPRFPPSVTPNPAKSYPELVQATEKRMAKNNAKLF